MLDKQIKYCDEKQIPMFAPPNGICYYCNKKITDKSDEHITGCEHCHHSYCD